MIEKCSLCGYCNMNSPLMTVTGNEALAPRFYAYLLRKGAFNEAFYGFVVDGSTEHLCPAKIDLDPLVLRARSKLVDLGKETEANKNMMAELREKGKLYQE